MRKISLLGLSVLLTACQTNVGTGIITGATIGLGAGGLGASTNPGTFVIGAAGAVVGGIIGALLDMQDRKVMEQSSPRTVERMDRGEPLTINDVIKLSQSGISDAIVLEYMQTTKSIYELTDSQVRRLQGSGVSQRIIQFMLASAR